MLNYKDQFFKQSRQIMNGNSLIFVKGLNPSRSHFISRLSLFRPGERSPE